MPRGGIADFKLGVESDEEDATPMRRGGGKKGKPKEESIEDLLGGKDSAMMFAGSSPGRRGGRASLDFGLGLGGGGSGSGDPLDMLRDSMARRSSAPSLGHPPQMDEPEMDEEELRFQLELQKELGMVGLGDAPGMGGADASSFANEMPSRRSPSPALAASRGGGDSDESLGDIVGDILDETPRPRQTQRRSSTPGRQQSDVAGLLDELEERHDRPSQRSTPASRAGSIPPRQGGFRDDSIGRGDSQDGDESPAMSRRGSASSRPPRADRNSLADARSARDESPFARDDSSLAREDVDYEAGMRQRMQEPLGRGRRGPSTAPSVTSDRDGSLASGHSGGADEPQLALGRRGGRGSEASGEASFQAPSLSVADTDTLAGTQSSGLGGRAGRRKLAPRPSLVAADDDPLADILGDNSASVGAGRGAPGRSASPGLASGAESRGSTTPPGHGRPFGTSAADTEGNEDAPLYAPKAQAPPPGPALNIELNVNKPKRRLGGPKAKASPDPSVSRTPPLDDELPSGRGTPLGGRSLTPTHTEAELAPPSPGPLPADDQASAAAFSAAHSGAMSGVPDRLQSPAHSMPQDEYDNDDDFDDDLLPDNTAPPPPAAAPAAVPEPRPAAQSQPAQSNSDDELPDFLKAGRERRARRGDQPRPAESQAGALKKQQAEALGLSAEDLEPSDQSASQLDKLPLGGGLEDSSASGSMLDVPLLSQPKGGRRRLAKPKPKSAAAAPAPAPPAPTIEEESKSQTGSAVGSAPSHASGSRVSPSAATGQVPVASPAQSAAPSLAQSVAQSAAQSVHSAAQSVARMGAAQALHAQAPPGGPMGSPHGSAGLMPSQQGSVGLAGLMPSPQGSVGSVGISGSAGALGSYAASGGHAVGVPPGSGGSSVSPVPAGASFVHAGAADAVQLAQAQALSASASAKSASQLPHVHQAPVTSPRLAQLSGQAALQAAAVHGAPGALALPLGVDSQPPSVSGDGFAAFRDLPLAALPKANLEAAGLPPGSPLTQTVQSESGSMHARFRLDDPIAAPQSQAGARAAAAAQAAAMAAAVAAGSPLPSDTRKSIMAGGGGTPTSEPVLSLFGSDAAHIDIGGRAHGGFSAFPPLSAAPSADLLSKLAYSEAKVKQLELQLEDAEQRRVQQLADQKMQADAEHERMELQCRKLESDLTRSKEMSEADMRHLNEKKQLMLQNYEMEKENARRDERRKAQMETEKLRADFALELEDLRRKHDRALSIAQQQADMEAESLRKANSGEHQLAKLVEQVQGSVAEVERMSKRVETDKTVEWSVRERQLEAREKNVREMEARLTSQSKEVEDQRRRVSELVRHMEDSQVDDRASLALERERLEAEHKRLLGLQQSVRDADRNNKEALKHAWAQLEDEKHSLQQEQLRIEGEMGARREELELQERQLRQETERLKALHAQVEASRQNASRRIRETEAMVANERRCLMNDLEIFEEKRRIFAGEVQKLDCEKQSLQEDRSGFENEVRSVGQMAAEVQRKSEELKSLQDEAVEARGEIQRLRGQLQEERTAQGSELERLKTMQTLVEQQRLQLLQTENQLRVRGIEDIDLLVTTQATFPGGGVDGLVAGALGMDFSGGATAPAGGDCAGPMEALLPATAVGQALSQVAPGMGQTLSPHGMASGGQLLPPQELVTKGASKAPARAAAPGLGSRMPATPGIAGGRAAARGMGSGSSTSSRMELQTLLRRTREASGDMQIFIQEQFRFLQQQGEHGQAGPREAASHGFGPFDSGGSAVGASRFTPSSALPADSWPPSGGLSGTPGFGLHSGIASSAVGNLAMYAPVMSHQAATAPGFGAIGGPGGSLIGGPAGYYPSTDSLGLAPLTSTSEEGDGGDYASATFEPFRPLSSDVEIPSSGGSAN